MNLQRIRIRLFTCLCGWALVAIGVIVLMVSV